MSEEDLNTYKKYVSDLDITKYIVLDSKSNYWYSAEYVDKMLKEQDKEIKKTEISYYRQQELLEKLKEFKEIPELIEQVERLESMLKNDLIIYV